MDGNGFEGSYPNGFLDIFDSISANEANQSVTRWLCLLTTKTVQLELVDTVDGFRILPVVLNEVEIVGRGE